MLLLVDHQFTGWIFDISKGTLLDLDYDYKAQMEAMKAIYDING